MGKGRKHHQPQTKAPSPPGPPATPPEAASRTEFKTGLARRIGWQLAALIGLSAVLGFAFNAGNPVGVRFAKAVSPGPAVSPLSTNQFNLISAASMTQTAAPAASPPEATPLRALLTAAARSTPVSNPLPHTPVSSPPLPTRVVIPPSPSNTPPANVVAAQTNLNPAPIHWLQAKPLAALGQGLLVDVRPRPVYDAGHIPDAISLPETTSPAEFAAFLNQLPTNLTLIVYCASTSCSQSQRVADRLVQEFHWPSVKYMTGGYQEYQREELAKAQPQPQPQTPP